MYKRKDGRPGSLEISQAVRKTAPGWRNRYSITVPIGRPICSTQKAPGRGVAGEIAIVLPIGRPIGSTQKAPGRRVVWRNRHSAVLPIGRAVGNTRKSAWSRGSWRNRNNTPHRDGYHPQITSQYGHCVHEALQARTIFSQNVYTAAN